MDKLGAAVGIQFEQAIRDDFKWILANERAAYAMPWSEQALLDSYQHQYQFFVIKDGDKIIGHLIYQTVADESHLLNVCITPRWQGQGVGKAAMVFWIEQAKQLGARLLILEVRRSNTRAQALYQSFGFKMVAQRKGYYPLPRQRREDGYVMTRDLNHLSETQKSF